MAFNKARAVQEAEKLVTQGKLAQAITQYLEIIASDPNDLGLLNTAGDLCVRANNIAEALKLFRRLADGYAREGFALRAIAIHRKITKLDPSALEPLLKLAELYIEQGLGREALKLYADALELARSRNQNEQALDILRRIVAADPENEAHRLRLAGCLEALGRAADAARAYVEAADAAWRRHDRDTASGLLAKAAELAPALPEVERLRSQLASESGAVEQPPSPAAASPGARAEAGIVDPITPPVEPAPSEAAEDGVSSLPVAEAPLEQPAAPSLAWETEADPPAPSPAPAAPLPEFDLSSEWEELAASGSTGVATPEPAFNAGESRAEIQFYLDAGLAMEARQSVAALEAQFPHHPQVAELRRLVEGRAAPQPAPASTRSQPRPSGGGVSAPVAAAANPLASFAADLESEWAGLEPSGPPPSRRASAPNASNAPKQFSAALSGLLDELRDESEAQTDEDPETHYNLGIAFREMGLLEEAIGEFQKVVKTEQPADSGSTFLRACSLLGLCFMDRQMPKLAAKWYRRALDSPELSEDARLALEYDLGMAWEQAGDAKAATECFLEVYSQNIDYRDVAEKIRLLQRGPA